MRRSSFPLSSAFSAISPSKKGSENTRPPQNSRTRSQSSAEDRAAYLRMLSREEGVSSDGFREEEQTGRSASLRHSNYRLPKDVLDAEVERVLDLESK